MPKEKKRPPRPQSSMPPERTSHTSVRPDGTSAPPPRRGQIQEDSAVTSSRAVQLREVPSVWLDRFLVAATEMPAGAGEEATVEALVDALFSIVKTYAVGACYVTRGVQKIVRRVPPGDEARALGVDPTRLFPGYTHERIFTLVGEGAGSTLHVAADDPTLDDDRAPVAHLAGRTAAVLARAVERARDRARLDAALRELRALEAHVIQADKLASFGEIAAGVVHELNNPLTSIVAYTDYLTKKFVEGKKAQMEADDVDRLRRIGQSAHRMLRFTRDLVSYARPSSEVAVPVVLHAVIDQALAFCEHLVAETGARVARRYSEETLTVRARPEQLAQIFVNLVTNACHAMPAEGGELSIETILSGDGASLEVRVQDNGHGIAAEHLGQIFDPFFTTKRQGRGTGLGLSIVKSIVEHHDGAIRVESEPGAYTRFVLRLPACVR